MRRVLATVLHIAVMVFAVMTIGFLCMALALLYTDPPYSPMVSRITAIVFGVYMVDMAILFAYIIGFALYTLVIAIRKERVGALLKPLLIGVPIAMLIGFLLEGSVRLIRYHTVWEGGILSTPLLFGLAAAVNVVRKWWKST